MEIVLETQVMRNRYAHVSRDCYIVKLHKLFFVQKTGFIDRRAGIHVSIEIWPLSRTCIKSYYTDTKPSQFATSRTGHKNIFK